MKTKPVQQTIRQCGNKVHMPPVGIRCYGTVVHVCSEDSGHSGNCECGCGWEWDSKQKGGD